MLGISSVVWADIAVKSRIGCQSWGGANVFTDGLICSEDFLYFVVVILFFLTLGIMKIEAHRAKRSQVMTVGLSVVIEVTVALGI